MHTPLDLKRQPFYSVLLVTPAKNIILEWPPGAVNRFAALSNVYNSHFGQIAPAWAEKRGRQERVKETLENIPIMYS